MADWKDSLTGRKVVLALRKDGVEATERKAVADGDRGRKVLVSAILPSGLYEGVFRSPNRADLVGEVNTELAATSRSCPQDYMGRLWAAK